MLGKIIGAALGRSAANRISTRIGGPAGAAIGYGLASRRLRKFAFGGLALMGGLAAVRALKGHRESEKTAAPSREFTGNARSPAVPGTAPGTAPGQEKTPPIAPSL